MKVAVTGGTGTIGQAVVHALAARGDEVTVLTRDPSKARSVLGPVEAVEWRDPTGEPAPAAALAGRDAVVNLLGESISQRWSEAAKRRIRDSRVLGTRNLVAGLRDAEPRPSVLVSGSAAGVYGARGDERLDESAPLGDDFLAVTGAAWEREAEAATDLGMRVVTVRTGVVLSAAEGALAEMLTPFKLGVGGPVAGGRQYVPWVHLDDIAGALRFCLDNSDAAGPVNASAPEPATNRELSKALGRVLRRPAVVPVPAAAMKLLFGEMAFVVVTGQRMVPERLTALGYTFRHPELEPALRDLLG